MRLIDADKLRPDVYLAKRGDYAISLQQINFARTVEPTLSDEQIEKIADLLETEWGYEGIREDVSTILRGVGYYLDRRQKMIKLEKCPFCGGEAIFNTTSIFSKSSELGFYYKIKCTRCGIAYPMEGKVSLALDEKGTVRYTEDNRLELASKWNTRIIEEAGNE